MKMESIFPNVSPAYLLNLADVNLSNLAGIIDYHWYINPVLMMRANLRIDHSLRDIYNEFGRKQLSAFWNGASSARTYTSYMPTHMENYGYFLYHILDGYFYTGNPDLKSERTYQIEFGLTDSYSFLTYRISLFYNLINQYISGVIQAEEFKIYTNIDNAVIMGASTNILLNLAHSLNLSLTLTYTYGQNKSFHEPLPLIPPLNGDLNISFHSGRYWLSTGAIFADSQKRIAFLTTLEDKTGPHVDWFFRGRMSIGSILELKFGVENILDLFYHQHLSINNLPAKGRNLYIGLNAVIMNN